MKPIAQFAFAFALTFLAKDALSVKVGQVEFPKTWAFKGNNLPIVGSGLREYSLLKIAVYAAAMYRANPQASAQTNVDAILSLNEPVVIHLQMLRDVSKEDSIKAWQYYIKANCVAPCKLEENSLSQFLSYVPNSTPSQKQTYIFSKDGLQVFINDVALGTISDDDFARTVLATWLGAKPTSEALKLALIAGNVNR